MVLSQIDMKIVFFVQNLLDENDKITPALISQKMQLVLELNPVWKAEAQQDAIIEEVIRRSRVRVGEDAGLINDEGHIPWLSYERKKDWRYWQRYRTHQENILSWKIAEGLEKSTDQILSYLEDPQREGSWYRRGLVVGHVQSGKTSNYTGLICKAADAGYKLIIVLTGMHNSLRSQTQIRLDEGFLGYTASPRHDEVRVTGVGNIDRDVSIRPNFGTTRLENGDFNARMARNLGVSPEQRPWLFVVKKNKSVLQSLLKWIHDHVANVTDKNTGRKMVSHLPLLVIDDEADNASIDTCNQVFDEKDNPNAEHEPTVINSLIRQILHTFTRKSYVGYTATPFANIFIHERSETTKEGPDLFPSSFVCNLSAASNYIGPSKVFGVSGEGGQSQALPLIRTMEDYCSKDGRSGWMPYKHKSSHTPLYDNEHDIPDSLMEAIHAFILSCALRRLRGEGDKHCSMLVHVTRFTLVQEAVKSQIANYICKLKQRLSRNIGHRSIIMQLCHLWEQDFVPSTRKVHAMYPDIVDQSRATWHDIEALLPDVISEIDVRAINGSAKEALDYADSAGGLKVIAIGGEKLSRGLTLEGLTVSYFLRPSRMYDTLMQMGRWFGYRQGYLDLCRLYTTEELVEWFKHITDASEELREEFELMVASGATPREYGLKVKSHPVLMVTSRVKMHQAKSLYLSFSGQSVETVSFLKDKKSLETNENAFERLSNKLGNPSNIPSRMRDDKVENWKGIQWSSVSAEYVCEFLEDFVTPPSAMKANGQLLSEFIRKMNKDGELTSWTVLVMSGGQERKVKVGARSEVHLTKRSPSGLNEGRYSIRRLLSPRDEAIDLDERAWQASLQLTRKAWHDDPAKENHTKNEPDRPSGPAIRKVRGYGADGIEGKPETGVLLIYLLDPAVLDKNAGRSSLPIVAFGISFPASDSGEKVRYAVNNVLWDQGYGKVY